MRVKVDFGRGGTGAVRVVGCVGVVGSGISERAGIFWGMG